MKDHDEMYHMDCKDTKKQAYKDKSDGSETRQRCFFVLTGDVLPNDDRNWRDGEICFLVPHS